MDIVNTPDIALTHEMRIERTVEAIDINDINTAQELLRDMRPCEDKLFLSGNISEISGDFAQARRFYYDAICRYGSSCARKALNALCARLSANYFENAVKTGDICDYSGKPIAFNRKNIPVCAELVREDERSVLKISLNVVQRNLGDMRLKKPDRVVIQGIKQWRGDYRVFGGYPVRVEISVTTELRRKNSLIVNVLDDETTDSVGSVLKKLGKRGERSAEILGSRRQSAAVIGRSWRPEGVKYINLYEKDLLSVPKCKFLMRHEFGHVLGLDDMYAEAGDGRPGVNEVYPDIEMYRIRGNTFNMIMCSVDAPVTFKDIEMVLLAYRDGQLQRFQRKDGKGEISSALREET